MSYNRKNMHNRRTSPVAAPKSSPLYALVPLLVLAALVFGFLR